MYAVTLPHPPSVRPSDPPQAALSEGYKIIDSDELRAAMNALVDDIAGVLVRYYWNRRKGLWSNGRPAGPSPPASVSPLTHQVNDPTHQSRNPGDPPVRGGGAAPAQPLEQGAGHRQLLHGPGQGARQ